MEILFHFNGKTTTKKLQCSVDKPIVGMVIHLHAIKIKLHDTNHQIVNVHYHTQHDRFFKKSRGRNVMG